MDKTFLNITIPVFNRYHLTQKTILHLKKLSPVIPFTITVVDNGSEKSLRDMLIMMANDKIIDNLFILPKNMGISCACNIGWKSMDSPYYMKLDNDIIIHRKDFLEHLFALVSCVEPMATFAPDFPMYMKNKNIKRVRTPHGVLGVCTSNLQGCALLIPKTVSDVLGYFNEDYGLYGADDGDYGYRMQCVGLPQYYYCKASYLTHEGSFDSSEYVGFGLDKGKEHQNLFVDENNGIGLFKINSFLFFYCLREYRVDERYEITKRDGYYIEVSEKNEYQKIKEGLNIIKKYIDDRIGPDELLSEYMLQDITDMCIKYGLKK